MRASALIARSSASTSARRCSSTRSALLSSRMSPYTTWARAIGLSWAVALKCSASIRVMIESSLSRSRRSPAMKVTATGRGSARPVVSTTIRSIGSGRSSTRCTASCNSPLIEQQMQPLLSSTIESLVATTSSLSMPTSPNSLTSTALRSPCWLLRMWLSRVVLPAPRKPVSSVTGTWTTCCPIHPSTDPPTCPCARTVLILADRRRGWSLRL